jgi:hypothetical protein
MRWQLLLLPILPRRKEVTMSWNRANWKTTVCGALAALSMVAGIILPPVKPIADGVLAVATACFGYFAADKETPR